MGEVGNPGPKQPERAIVICCFGRGGSSILWRMIGSSPDAVMTTREWHQAVFGNARRLRNLTTLVFETSGITSLGPLRRHAFRNILRARSGPDMAAKPGAEAIVIKLMDRHLVFGEMLRLSFPRTDFVVLARHPYAQCESLLRSGMTLAQSCDWYNLTSRHMKRYASNGAPVVRFEDIVEDPIAVCDRVYRALGIGWAGDRKFVFKVKRFGPDRGQNEDAAAGEEIRIGSADVAAWINPGAARDGAKRLSAVQRDEIWQRTGALAQNFGYGNVL